MTVKRVSLLFRRLKLLRRADLLLISLDISNVLFVISYLKSVLTHLQPEWCVRRYVNSYGWPCYCFVECYVVDCRTVSTIIDACRQNLRSLIGKAVGCTEKIETAGKGTQISFVHSTVLCWVSCLDLPWSFYGFSSSCSVFSEYLYIQCSCFLIIVWSLRERVL